MLRRSLASVLVERRRFCTGPWPRCAAAAIAAPFLHMFDSYSRCRKRSD